MAAVHQFFFQLYNKKTLCNTTFLTISDCYDHTQCIYSQPQTDCFVLSELFCIDRHVGRSKLESKPIQTYVSLSLRPLGQRVCLCSVSFKVFWHVCLYVYFCTFVCLSVCAIVYVYRRLSEIQVITIYSSKILININIKQYSYITGSTLLYMRDRCILTII